MEAIETIVSLQISGELEAFAPKPLIVGRGLTKVYRNDAFEVRALDGMDIDNSNAWLSLAPSPSVHKSCSAMNQPVRLTSELV